MSDQLLGIPPRNIIFDERSETRVHRLFLPLVARASLVQYVLGTDVSKWNGVMNWQKNFDAGGRFTWVRLGSISKTGGACYLDYQWERNSDIAPLFMPAGGYWYFRPAHDANKQADYVCKHIQEKELSLPFALDAENNDTHMAARYVEKQLLQFVERMYENIGKRSIIYTSKGFWSYPNIFASSGSPAWAAAHDLWVANYTLRPTPAMPVTWLSWKFWQWSADGNYRGEEFGGERPPGAPPPSMDLNRFNGNQDALNYYVTAYNDDNSAPDPPDPPQGVPLEAWAKELDLWARGEGYVGVAPE